MLQSRVLYKGLVLQPRHNRPSADCLQDTRNHPCCGWLGLACYHVYIGIWKASTGEQLLYQHENADLFAVVTVM